MKHRTSASLLAVLPLLAGCGSAAEAPQASPEPAQVRLPASALAGAVRALETLDAVRPEDALTQIRALDCDTLLDPRTGVETVRVFLHLTVYATTSERAFEAFEEVRLALETEARSGERVEPASAERVGRVLGELAWEQPGREDLVSFSEAIRLEIRPGQSLAALPESASAPGQELHDSLASYVRTAAARGIGPVDLARSQRGVAPGISDHRFRIAPAQAFSRYTRADIGAFLAALEGGSPVARVTRLAIERSQHEPDPHAARGWTFEAELSVRALEPSEPRAPAAASAGR